MVTEFKRFLSTAASAFMAVTLATSSLALNKEKATMPMQLYEAHSHDEHQEFNDHDSPMEDSAAHIHEHQHSPEEPPHSHSHRHGAETIGFDGKVMFGRVPFGFGGPLLSHLKFSSLNEAPCLQSHISGIFRPPIA